MQDVGGNVAGPVPGAGRRDTSDGRKVFLGELAIASDSDLLRMLHDGDDAALATLWERHIGAALRVARTASSSFEPEDVAAEAFARALSAIRNGGGPQHAFRAYLVTTVRSIVASWGRQRGHFPMTETEHLDQFQASELMDTVDKLTVRTAFATLPDRWRTVLWYSEVEGMGATEIAGKLDITPAAAAMLTYRARQGLRRAWHAAASD